jgi:hypothetical protein
VGIDRVVALSGSGPIQFNATLALSEWRGNLAGSSLAGTLRFTIATNTPVGSATVSGNFALAQ